MNARLTTAINIGDAARAIFRKTKCFPDNKYETDEDWFGHFGVEPMLLALSMELALKAWFVFDHDNPNVIKSHNLIKLFDGLSVESQQKLDTAFKASVAPYHPSILYPEYGIRNLLYQHQNAFTDWRYLHERKKSMLFDQSAFEATLEMVLTEFRKRYRVVPTSASSPFR